MGECERCKGRCSGLDDEDMEKLEKSKYAQAIAGAVVGMAGAVELALNLRDMAVLGELERLCSEIFTQARAALGESGQRMN